MQVFFYILKGVFFRIKVTRVKPTRKKPSKVFILNKSKRKVSFLAVSNKASNKHFFTAISLAVALYFTIGCHKRTTN